MFRFAAPVMTESLRRIGLLGLACSALTLAACGGGDRAKAYVPDNIIVFGDDNAALTSASTASSSSATATAIKGLVYSVNVVAGVSISPVFSSTGYYYCSDSDATTQCSTSTAVSNLSGFTLADETSTRFGTGYHFGASTDNPNVVTFVGLGSGPDTSGTTTVNGVKRTVDLQYTCTASSNAILTLVHAFGRGFRDNADGCPVDYSGATLYASGGWKVAEVVNAINTHLSELKSGVLVTVWVGQNDVLEIYGGSATLADKLTTAKGRGEQLAAALRTVLGTGAKLLVINVPDLAYSPYGGGCGNSSACSSDLHQVVDAFNHTLIYGDQALGYKGLSSYATDGRHLGLVDAQLITQQYAINTSYVNSRICEPGTSTSVSRMFTPDGTSDSTVSTNVQYCSTLSLVSGGSTSTYLWADDKHPAWVLHSAIGSLAYSRATNQF